MSKNLTAFIVSLLLFGTNGIVASQIDLPSYDIVVLRTLLGAGLLGVLYLATKARRKSDSAIEKTKVNKKEVAFVAISGMFLGVSWLLLFEAYTLVGVGTASLLYYCGPVIVMTLSPILFGESLTRLRVVGFAIVLTGIVLVNGGGFENMTSPIGLVYSLLAAVCMAAMITFNKKAEHITGLQNSLIQLIGAFAAAAIGTALLHGLSMDVKASDWPYIIVLGLVNTGLGCYLYFGNLGRIKAQTVAVCGYIEPVSAVVFAVAFLGEPMTGLQALGAVLVLGGAAASELAPLLANLARLSLPPMRKARIQVEK